MAKKDSKSTVEELATKVEEKIVEEDKTKAIEEEIETEPTVEEPKFKTFPYTVKYNGKYYEPGEKIPC